MTHTVEVNFAVDDLAGGLQAACRMLLNRMQCFLGARYLEAVDVRLKGSPHEQLARWSTIQM